MLLTAFVCKNDRFMNGDRTEEENAGGERWGQDLRGAGLEELVDDHRLLELLGVPLLHDGSLEARGVWGALGVRCEPGDLNFFQAAAVFLAMFVHYCWGNSNLVCGLKVNNKKCVI